MLLVALSGWFAESHANDDLERLCQPFVSSEHQQPLDIGAAPYSESVFWRIDKPNIPASFILGTLHSQDRQATHPSPQARLRLAQSERLLIEVEPGPQSNATYLKAMFQRDGQSLEDALPKPLYKRLSRIATDYGLPPEQLPQLKPWAAFSYIGRPKPVNGPTLDQVIYEMAVQMGKSVVGLETMAELIASLNSISHADQITILKDSICNHARIVRQSKTLLEMYVAGDLAAMVAFNNQPHHDEAVFDRFMQAVLYDRNQRLFERMQPYLERGGNFIALGALHLPEEKGLLALIEAAGYHVTPLE